MLSRLAVLAFAGIIAFSPVVHLSMTNERGVLFMRAWVDGVGPLLFVLDPGAQDVITTYGRDRLGGKQPFPVFPGDPQQLDPQHDQANGTIAGSIGPGLLRYYIVRIDYAKAEIVLVPFDAPDPARDAQSFPLRIDGFGMPTIAASVDGAHGQFEIDVRAPFSLLFTPFVRKHQFRGVGHTVTLGRYTVHDSAMRLSQASAGKFASAEVAGLIGNDVLSGFVVTFDYHRQTLYLER